MKLDRAAPFFAGLWAGTVPLLVWGLHFAFSYVAVAAMCTSALKAGTGDAPALRWSLVVATTLAVVMLAVMLWRSRTRGAPPGYVQLVRRVCAALSLIGVVWAGVPLAMLPVCTP